MVKVNLYFAESTSNELAQQSHAVRVVLLGGVKERVPGRPVIRVAELLELSRISLDPLGDRVQSLLPGGFSAEGLVMIRDAEDQVTGPLQALRRMRAQMMSQIPRQPFVYCFEHISRVAAWRSFFQSRALSLGPLPGPLETAATETKEAGEQSGLKH